MEEERKNTPGLFYAITGVATLVVAIIGATFAYFSASAQVTGGANAITGGTNSDLSKALKATVERINFSGANAGSDSLVPSDITAVATSINAAVNAKCVSGGYTGCHLYKITASSTQNVSAVDLKLESMTLTGVKNKADWKYVIYPGTDTVNTATNSIQASTTFEAANVSIYDGALTANKPVYYYLLVYIANQEKPQNAGDTSDVTGTYKGTVSFAAAGGGQVSASFTAGA